MTTSTKRTIRSFLPPSILIRIYRRLAERYIDSLTPSHDPAKKTILALNHFYEQDLRALSQACRDYNFVVVDAPRLVRGAKLFFDDDVIQLNAPYDSSSPSKRAAWQNECRRLLDRVDKRFGIDLMITPADCFWWIREMIDVGHERGFKTVVIDKEGIISPYDFEAAANRIRMMAPFMSDHLYVWSERQRVFWNRIGVSNENISVIGQPRSDLFYCEATNEVDALFPRSQPTIVFFTYMHDAYIPIELATAEGLTWTVMRDETHEEVSRLAQQFPNYNFVVKAHPQQPDRQLLKDRYERDNLRVVGGSSIANELIQRSTLIIAFQTTAVIEAMFMGKRVVYTYWSELLPRLESDLLPFHNAPGIRIARSLQEFRQTCERVLTGDKSMFEFSQETLAARDRFVNEYLYRPDGHVCERFFDSVGRYIR